MSTDFGNVNLTVPFISKILRSIISRVNFYFKRRRLDRGNQTPALELKLNFKEEAKVHRFYNDMRINMKDKEPNAAHLQIAKWQEQYGEENVINITQNIDDLFEKANVKNTIHLHGELTKMNCHV